MATITEVMGKNFALKNAVKRINGVPVTVKTYLDADNYSEIVNTIANSCFDKNGDIALNIVRLQEDM